MCSKVYVFSMSQMVKKSPLSWDNSIYRKCQWSTKYLLVPCTYLAIWPADHSLISNHNNINEAMHEYPAVMLADILPYCFLDTTDCIITHTTEGMLYIFNIYIKETIRKYISEHDSRVHFISCIHMYLHSQVAIHCSHT